MDTTSRRFVLSDNHKQAHHYTKKHVAVAPLEQPKGDPTHQPSEPGASEMSETRIFTESVRLLHESEAVAVIEYIETVMPVLYTLYISIIFRLSNAQYYQDMKEFTAEATPRGGQHPALRVHGVAEPPRDAPDAQAQLWRVDAPPAGVRDGE